MSSIGQSGGADPRLLGRESLDELEALEQEPTENKVDEVQPKPTRFRGFVGAAWQRVQGIFRRSRGSNCGTAEDEEEPELEAIGHCEHAAENPESIAASLEGDFRTLPACAWEKLHARFCETKIEQETSEFSTAPTDAAPESPHTEDADAPGPEIDMPVDSEGMRTDAWPADPRPPDARLNKRNLVQLQY
ncbi:unnamed protein product [Symbiodinium sp. CCMP2592]|nr:unnamed protein product [Symbiodinium sp. CCMP2592]